MDAAPLLRASCDGCGCPTGSRHSLDCARAVCESSGLPWLDCPCPKPAKPDAIVSTEGWPTLEEYRGHGVDRYQGEWPYDVAARSLGLWIRWNVDRGRWERCRQIEPGSGPDVARIQEVGRWSAQQHCWEPRYAVLYIRLTAAEANDHEAEHDALDTKSFRLRRWVLETGFQIAGELHDVGRLAGGWRDVLRYVDQGARPWANDGVKADVVAIEDQRDLGSTNKVRVAAIQKVKDRGGVVLSRKLWDDAEYVPLSAQLRYAIDARALMGPEPTEEN